MSPATLSFSLSVEMSSGRAWEIDAHASCLGIAYPHKPPTCPLLPVVKSLSLSLYPVVIPLPSVSGSICTGKIITFWYIDNYIRMTDGSVSFLPVNQTNTEWLTCICPLHLF